MAFIEVLLWNCKNQLGPAIFMPVKLHVTFWYLNSKYQQFFSNLCSYICFHPGLWWKYFSRSGLQTTFYTNNKLKGIQWLTNYVWVQYSLILSFVSLLFVRLLTSIYESGLPVGSGTIPRIRRSDLQTKTVQASI